MRFYILFFIFYSFISCKRISSKNKDLRELDTVIDFTRVDSSPYFKKCSSLIDQKRTKCFEKTIRIKVSNLLKSYSSSISEEFDERILVMLKITKKGKFRVESIQKSSEFSSLAPGFDSYIKKSIRKLPKVYPALKQGIPVEVQYKLPIHIISN